MTVGRLILTAALLFCAALPLSAAQKEERAMKVAVNPFSSADAPDSYPLALEELLSAKLYNIPFMALLDRQQMELVARKNGISGSGAFDIAYATRLGRLLSVDKIVLGSVRGRSGVEITVKVVDVAESTVEFIVTQKAADSTEFDAAAGRIASEIETFYREGRRRPFSYHLRASAGLLYPANYLSKEIGGGYGADVAVSGMITDRESVQFAFGVTRFVTEKSFVSSFNLVSISLQGQYHVKITDRITIIPSPGAGYCIGQKVYDPIRERNNGAHIFRTAYFYNPMVLLNAEMRWRFLDRTALSAVFINQLIGEKDRLNYFPGLALGFSVSF